MNPTSAQTLRVSQLFLLVFRSRAGAGFTDHAEQLLQPFLRRGRGSVSGSIEILVEAVDKPIESSLDARCGEDGLRERSFDVHDG
jgi:hypothetical protein